MELLRRYYRQVWAVDFEFTAPPGERPTPLCMVGRELISGRLLRIWLDGRESIGGPIPTGADALFVAYYASAELGCHLALDWPLPTRILDLYAELRCLTSGLDVPSGYGLLGALAVFGLDGLSVADKKSMQVLAMRGGPFTAAEQLALLDYCQTDVDALEKLLPAMLPHIDLPRALLRGRYMAAAARIECQGIPIDTDAHEKLRDNWPRIRGRLIAEVDRDYGVFVPTGRKLTRDTRSGTAILDMADDWGIDPYQLAEAVDYLRQQEQETKADSLDARRRARSFTGLTVKKIHRWEDAGKDYASWPGLDDIARQVAGEVPALGIGAGYQQDMGYENIDYAERLWELLREEDDRVRPKDDPDLLREAGELVLAHPDYDWRYFGDVSFSTQEFAKYLSRVNIPWPRLESGALALDDDTFREMARAYPSEIGPLRDLRHMLSQMKLNDLAVGRDGRNRCLLSAFASKTGRNQPSTSKFIFGPSCWLRCLIKPEPGRALAYVDWSQQELAIAAALSGDAAMWDAYRSGDFYLTFAKMAGAVPVDATKATHGDIRDQYKTVALGVLYGLSEISLARRLGVPGRQGRHLLQMHKDVFRDFWKWSEQVEMEAILSGRLQTVFGWRLHVGPNTKARSLRNFPMQANGAEMMRLACCLTTEQGIRVCAVVHDALLVEASVDAIDDIVYRTQKAMCEASEIVLPGFPLRTDAKIVRWPDRYIDPRGERTWAIVHEVLQELENEVETSEYPCHF